MVDFTVPTDPAMSKVYGRNGRARCSAIICRVWPHQPNQVQLDFLNSRGDVTVGAGAEISLEAMDQIAKLWLEARGEQMKDGGFVL